MQCRINKTLCWQVSFQAGEVSAFPIHCNRACVSHMRLPSCVFIFYHEPQLCRRLAKKHRRWMGCTCDGKVSNPSPEHRLAQHGFESTRKLLFASPVARPQLQRCRRRRRVWKGAMRLMTHNVLQCVAVTVAAVSAIRLWAESRVEHGMPGNKKGVQNGFPLIIKATSMKYEALMLVL